MQPYNYNVQQINPMGSALKGMQTGMAFNQQEQQQDLTNQKIQLQNQLIQDNAMKRQSAIAKTQANLKLQESLADLATNYSPDKAEKVLLQHPSLIKDMLPLLENINSKDKQETIGDLMRLHHQSINNPDSVVEELKSRYETYEEAGDNENAELYKGFYENALANKDNDSVKAILDIGIGSLLGPEKYTEYHKRLAETAKLKKETGKLEKETGLLERGMKVDEAKAKAAGDQATASLMNAKIADLASKSRDFKDRNDSKMYSALQKEYGAIAKSLIQGNKLVKMIPKDKDGKSLWKGGFLGTLSDKAKTQLGQELDNSEQARRDFTIAAKEMMVAEAQGRRVEGSGQQSDVEFNAYLETVPKIEDNGTTMTNWLIRFQDFKRRELGMNKIMIKWMDKHNGSRSSKGGVELIKGMPKTKEGELPQEYLERTGYSFKKAESSSTPPPGSRVRKFNPQTGRVE